MTTLTSEKRDQLGQRVRKLWWELIDFSPQTPEWEHEDETAREIYRSIGAAIWGDCIAENVEKIAEASISRIEEDDTRDLIVRNKHLGHLLGFLAVETSGLQVRVEPGVLAHESKVRVPRRVYPIASAFLAGYRTEKAGPRSEPHALKDEEGSE